MERVVVCGAGFGGIAAATALRRALPPEQLEIVLIDRRAEFMMGLRKTWAVLGMALPADGRRRLEQIRDVNLVRGEIESVDIARRAIRVDGREISGDSLVLALGARHALDATPGLAQRGLNVWDVAQIDRARRAIEGLGGGRLVIGIFGMPYACPPGPFELALLARDRLGAQVDISVFSPAPIALPVLGPVESAKLERMLEDAGIEFLRQRQVAEVSDRQVGFRDGSALAFDVLLAVPPHRCPQVLVEAGLAEPDGWVKPHRQTLETAQPGVYAIGDCTAITLANGLPLPKAGVIAAAQGEVVAARIAATLVGSMPDATFAGDVLCYIETGAGRAAMASGSFYTEPSPAVTITEPTAGQLAGKREFERSYLAAWFGR